LQKARKRGLNPVIILTGHPENIAELHKLTEHFHIPLYTAAYPHELGIMALR
jgi:hypothetical protein